MRAKFWIDKKTSSKIEEIVSKIGIITSNTSVIAGVLIFLSFWKALNGVRYLITESIVFPFAISAVLVIIKRHDSRKVSSFACTATSPQTGSNLRTK